VEVPWEAEPHTLAKHAIYRQYLSKWMPIMVNGFDGDVTYAEGYAGPGVYLGREPGSPVIALRSVLRDAKLRTRLGAAADKGVRLLFVDAEPKCTDMLIKRLALAAEPVALTDLAGYGLVVDVVTGTCEPELDAMLTRHGAWGRPMLVVLDTWGGGVPLDLVRKVAANGSSEVIITILPQYFTRFAEATDLRTGDEVFGGISWREVARKPSAEKSRWLLGHYRETVKTAGFSHVLDFELMGSNRQPLYLVFGTTHERGLEKMKEAMWEVDDVAGAGYRDPRDPDQQTLNIELEPQTGPLRRQIRDHLASLPGRRATVEALRRFALLTTVYKASQVRPVLVEMIRSGELSGPRDGTVPSFRDTVVLN
jgi:three-Cys-motif partner protein